MSENSVSSVLECKALCKSFSDGEKQVNVLKNVEFNLKHSEYAAIIGRSGSGKTTLLHMLAGLDTPDSGDVLVNGEQFSALSANDRGLLRNKHIGFVYQFHHLLPEFNALENIMMPLLIGKMGQSKAKAIAKDFLAKVGLSDRASHRAAALSGGERQRVAIARALVNQPSCVLADEPTGNLDSQNAEMIHQLMLELNTTLGTSFVVVTHDEQLAAKYQSVYHMTDGILKAV